MLRTLSRRSATHPRSTQISARLASFKARLFPALPTPAPTVDPLQVEAETFFPFGIEEAPPEIEIEPSTTTPAAPEHLDLLSIDDIISHEDRRHFERMMFEADLTERDNLKAELVRIYELENDAKNCGFGADYSDEIFEIEKRIAELNNNLADYELCEVLR